MCSATSHAKPPGTRTFSAGPARSHAERFASADAALIAAREAALRNDSTAFEQAARQVGPLHPLHVYLDYWRLRNQLATDPSEQTDAALQRLIARHPNTLVADLARRDWILALARRQAWEAILPLAEALAPPTDNALQCVVLHARWATGQTVTEPARPLLLTPRELPDSCQALLKKWVDQGVWSPSDVATRLTRALESGSDTALRQVLSVLAPALTRAQVERAWNQPLKTLTGTESGTLTLVAWTRLARTDPAQAATLLKQRPGGLSSREQSFVWSQIAARGMLKLMPQAHEWALKAREAAVSDDTLMTLARAALRAQDWAALRHTIERMSPATRNESTWTYWLGRAWQADRLRPEAPQRAHALWTAIAAQTDFYGQLAAEELGLPKKIPPKPAPSTASELAAIRHHAGLARALRWYELGLRTEGNREWGFHVRTMNDRELLAAAEFARQQGLLDRTVHAAERTRHEHDFSLRYPTPFAQQLEPIARAQSLDPAWIYGLIRQESRFVSDARSIVGAQGLMQIMPATGRWIARKLGHTGFDTERLHDLDTNLQFGTYYLRTLFDKLERSAVLASAGYNAGPGRPRAWQGTLSGPVEGAIFAETIPFTETRQYVKHVLANTVWYAMLLTQQPQSIKAWLGTIAPAPVSAASASPDGD